MARTVSLPAVLVRVAEGVTLWRHGTCWTCGDVLEVTPADAARLVWMGDVEVLGHAA